MVQNLCLLADLWANITNIIWLYIMSHMTMMWYHFSPCTRVPGYSFSNHQEYCLLWQCCESDQSSTLIQNLTHHTSRASCFSHFQSFNSCCNLFFRNENKIDMWFKIFVYWQIFGPISRILYDYIMSHMTMMWYHFSPCTRVPGYSFSNH